MVTNIFGSHLPNMAIASYTSNVPQNDTSIYLGLCVSPLGALTLSARFQRPVESGHKYLDISQDPRIIVLRAPILWFSL